MTGFRTLIVPLVVVGCGGLAACTTTPARTTQSLAPASASAAQTSSDAVQSDSAGDAEDASRSLAYEVETNGGKQGKVNKKPLATDAPSPEAMAGAQQAAQLAGVEPAGKDGAPSSEPDLPLTAMLPEQKPAALQGRLAASQNANTVQVASLDPSIGVASERFGTAEGQLETRPMAAGLAPAGDQAGDAARPVPDGRIGPSSVGARSPELDQLIAHYSDYYEVPETLVRRVIKRESTFNPKATNGPYMGLMQISVPTARGMGYRGNRAGLLDAETNLKFAVRYLRGAYLVARGNHDRADRLYQSGYYYHAKRAGLLDETGVGRDRKRRGRL